jgi:hypothetical protein
MKKMFNCCGWLLGRPPIDVPGGGYGRPREASGVLRPPQRISEVVAPPMGPTEGG